MLSLLQLSLSILKVFSVCCAQEFCETAAGLDFKAFSQQALNDLLVALKDNNPSITYCHVCLFDFSPVAPQNGLSI